MGSLNTPSPGPGGGGDFGPSQLAGPPASGQDGQPAQPNQDMSGLPGNNMDSQGNALAVVVEQVRGMEQGLLSLSQQFPAANNEVRQAVDAIRAVLQRIVSSPPAGAEPPSPQSLA